MKNRILTLILAFAALLSSEKAMAWATWGHHISAYIAEQHLTPEAKAQCRKYLRHTLPHYSSWQDYWRHSHPFKEITHWHMNYIDKDFNTIGKGGNITRDATTQVERITKEMEKGKYRNLSDSMVIVNLKLLIHMVVDMHCPCHVGYHKDSQLRGGSIMVKGKKMGRHKFWDASPQLMHPKWKLDDFLKAYDTYSAKEIKKVSKGTPTKWGRQNAYKMVKTYTMWEKDAEFTKLSKKQRQEIDDVVREQLAYGGYRLAGILNYIFSK